MKNRREFIREKRRQIKVARKAHEELYRDCMLSDYFDGTFSFAVAVMTMGEAIRRMDVYFR